MTELKPHDGFVAIVLGSASDKEVAKKVTDLLDGFEIKYELRIISAHRLPHKMAEYASNLHNRGCKAVIGIAGMAAALPGCLAAHTLLPVIGVPAGGGAFNGQDALHSIVQMPKGVPVACVAINGGINAALLAIRIMAVDNKDIKNRLFTWKGAMRRKCEEEINSLQITI